MALKHTVSEMKHLMTEIMHDLEKSEKGNRAASQRVRTLSIRFAKTAKVFRKESVAEAKKGMKKATAKAKKKAVAKKKSAKRRRR